MCLVGGGDATMKSGVVKLGMGGMPKSGVMKMKGGGNQALKRKQALKNLVEAENSRSKIWQYQAQKTLN